MDVQFLVYVFGLPATFTLSNLIVFLISKKLETPVAEDFKEVTPNWVTFFNNGIPVPTDHERIEGIFIGEPVFVQPLLEK